MKASPRIRAWNKTEWVWHPHEPYSPHSQTPSLSTRTPQRVRQHGSLRTRHWPGSKRSDDQALVVRRPRWYRGRAKLVWPWWCRHLPLRRVGARDARVHVRWGAVGSICGYRRRVQNPLRPCRKKKKRLNKKEGWGWDSIFFYLKGPYNELANFAE